MPIACTGNADAALASPPAHKQWPPPPPPPLVHAPSAAPRPSPRSAVNKAQCVQAFASKRPVLGNDVFVAPNASVIGDVKLGSGASVWYGAVIRGEWLGTASQRCC